MKSAGNIRHQLKSVRFRHLKKRIEAVLRQLPANCTHNREFRHPKVVAVDGGPCSVCVSPDQEGEVLCDVAWGGAQKAKGCSWFEAATTKEAVKAEFMEWLSTALLAEIAAEYPDMAALLWVLQEDAPNREVEDEDWEPDEDTEEEFLLEFADVTLRMSSPEDVVLVERELASMLLAIDTAMHLKNTKEAINKRLQKDNETLVARAKAVETLSTQFQNDLRAKTAAHQTAADKVKELQRQLKARPKLPAPRVTWWSRLFGGA